MGTEYLKYYHGSLLVILQNHVRCCSDQIWNWIFETVRWIPAIKLWRWGTTAYSIRKQTIGSSNGNCVPLQESQSA